MKRARIINPFSKAAIKRKMVFFLSAHNNRTEVTSYANIRMAVKKYPMVGEFFNPRPYHWNREV